MRARTLQFVVDAAVVVVAFALAYAVRFEGYPPELFASQFVHVLPFVVFIRLGMILVFRVHRLVWRYISLRDIPRMLAAVTAGSMVLLACRFLLGPILSTFHQTATNWTTIPFGVLAAEFVLTVGGMITVRAIWRLRTEKVGRKTAAGTSGKSKALLIGAGSGGVMIAREVLNNPDVGFEVVGFLDDDQKKHGSIVHGFKVLGATSRLGEFARARGAELAVISMAKVPAKVIRRIVDLAERASLKVQIIPGLYEILSGKLNISKIRDVAIEDLLGRDPVSLEEEQIGAFLTDKTVLITGAGGSIGSEICRQVARYEPASLVLVDQAENPLFHIHRELSHANPGLSLTPAIGNVVDKSRIEELFAQHCPNVVFHAAAHKHVPMMELNPKEAIRNNVIGSRNLADLANAHEVDAFVMVSTDKAVNPTSVMGASKRLAEMYVQALSTRSKTRFITVRFGNVLGSDGSVIPLFKEQIKKGGPVTVTHPEMKRYFMTIPEASQLVLQAATMGKGGEIFILEMGTPLKIVNLARDLIRLSGLRPDEDIQIEFSGIRPGEKLYEEINLSEENATKTQHPRIWIGICKVPDLQTMRDKIDALVAAAAKLGISTDAAGALRNKLGECVPEYRHQREAVQEDGGSPSTGDAAKTAAEIASPGALLQSVGAPGAK